MTRDLAAMRDGLLLAYGPEATAEVRVIRIRNDGSLGIARSHGVIDYAPAMAGLWSRVLLFGDFPNELLVVDAEGRLIPRGIRVAEADLAEGRPLPRAASRFCWFGRKGGDRGAAGRSGGRFLSDAIPIAARGFGSASPRMARIFL